MIYAFQIILAYYHLIPKFRTTYYVRIKEHISPTNVRLYHNEF